jgi:hypothetical protein
MLAVPGIVTVKVSARNTVPPHNTATQTTANLTNKDLITISPPKESLAIRTRTDAPYRFIRFEADLLFRLLMTLATPANPVPKSNIVPGSGTGRVPCASASMAKWSKIIASFLPNILNSTLVMSGSPGLTESSKYKFLMAPS